MLDQVDSTAARGVAYLWWLVPFRYVADEGHYLNPSFLAFSFRCLALYSIVVCSGIFFKQRNRQQWSCDLVHSSTYRFQVWRSDTPKSLWITIRYPNNKKLRLYPVQHVELRARDQCQHSDGYDTRPLKRNLDNHWVVGPSWVVLTICSVYLY